MPVIAGWPAGDDACLSNLAKRCGLAAIDDGKRGAIAPWPLLPGLEAAQTGVPRFVRCRPDQLNRWWRNRQLDIVLFGSQVIMLNLCHHLRGLLQRRARRQLYLSKKYAAIFQRQEGGRQTNKQERHHADNRQVEQQPAAALQQNARYAALVAFGAGIEVTVKPAEESRCRAMCWPCARLEQRGSTARESESSPPAPTAPSPRRW